MSIFGSIVNAIFGTAKAAGAAVAGAATAVTGVGKPTPMSRADVEAMIQKLEDASGQDYNWKQSIVDLMKLLKLDSSLTSASSSPRSWAIPASSTAPPR